MSMNFNQPLTSENSLFLREFMGDKIVVMDEQTALLNTRFIASEEMGTIARELNQVVTVELNEPGDIKTLSDGTQYRVTSKGWRKIK